MTSKRFGVSMGLLMFLLIITSVSACDLSTNFVEGRYRFDDLTSLNVNCTNATALSCSYSINDFANFTINNCSDFSIRAELGWNRLTLCATDSIMNCSVFNFWAKKLVGGNSADYVVMIVLSLLSVGLFLIGVTLNSPVLGVMGCFGGVVLGYELLSFSMISGLLMIIISGLLMLATSLKVKSGT